MRYSQLCDVTYGNGVLKDVPSIAKNMGMSRILVVTDENVRKTGHPDKMIGFLKEAGLLVDIYDKVEMDAPDYCVNAGAKIAYDFKADGIVAIGGGSCLDCAKAICVEGSNYGKVKIQDLFDSAPGSIPLNPPIKNIMVPTTSGTGSEVTIVAVINDTVKHRKCGCIVKPNAAVVDPELVVGLDPLTTAFTAMDAFSHSSEALASKGNNPHSDLLALAAIERIVRWAPVAVKDTKDLKAREELAIASNFAGKAFNDSMVNVGHALAHSLGAVLHIAHGIGCALVTPVVVEYCAKSRPDMFFKFADIFGIKPSCDQLGSKLGEAIKNFCRTIGIPSLKSLGFSREQVSGCAEYAKTEGMRFACLVDIPDDELHVMLEKVYDNYQ